MSLRLHLNRRLYMSIGAVILMASALVSGIILYIGSSANTEAELMPSQPGSPSVSASSRVYDGPMSLETMIVGSKVIAKVKLVSVAQVVEELKDPLINDEVSVYVQALEFTFNVLEYLRGSGGSQLVAIAYDSDALYATKEAAAASSEDFLSARDTRWDDREAVVFLWNDHPYLPSTNQTDRYVMGLLRFHGDDHYTVASIRYRRWLPEATFGDMSVAAATASALGMSEQRFLLETPFNEEAQQAQGAQSQSSETPTITLAEMKAKIAVLQTEIDDGDGSEEYFKCVFEKYRWEGEVRYKKELYASKGEGYPSMRYGYELDSGLPVETSIYMFEGAHLYVEAYGETISSKYEAMFQLWGQDEHLFEVDYPGEVSLARPLPAGKYEFYFVGTPKKYVICDGMPEEERKRLEHFVTVTPPTGTLHEAFFDPIAEGAALVADDFRGALEPTDFKSGDSTTTITRIGWDANRAWMALSSSPSLAGHHIDFIELDGSVGLTLDFDDATATSTDDGAHALIWGVCGQPWTAGDKLMLRMSLSDETLTGTTNDSSCDGAPIDTTTPPAIGPLPCTNGVAVPNPTDNRELVRDCNVLLDALDVLVGADDDPLIAWSDDKAMDSWAGVRMSGTPVRVTQLALAYKGLMGTLPSVLGDLNALTRVDMRSNRLTGSIPSEMGDLTGLEYLHLKGNDLSGAIPSELGKLTNLEKLYLNDNDLTGAIPSELGELTHLVYVYILAGNDLTGCVPASWSDIDKSEDPTKHGLSYCESE